MNSYLNFDNLEKIKNLAKILGVQNKYDFEAEDGIHDFLDKNIQNHEEIFDTYLIELSNVYGQAIEKSINDTLKTEQKFKHVNGYLVLPWGELYEFLKEHPINKFKDLEKLEINGEINLENAASDYYSEIDNDLIKDLNIEIGKNLDASLEIIEENPEYAENVKEFQYLVKNLKFKEGKFGIYAPYNSGQATYKLELQKKTILIQNIDYAERKISVFIIEYKDKAKKKILKKLKGNIPYENLANYTQHYSLFESEIREKIRKILHVKD